MRKTLLLSLALTALLVLVIQPLPTLAQEEKKTMPPEGMSMALPKPLADDLFTWMVGEWEGWSTSPMGKSQDWQKIEWSLDNQFVTTHYTAKHTEVNQEEMKKWSESMKMSKEDMDKMKDMVYKGMGPMTINPQTGEIVGYWFDNLARHVQRHRQARRQQGHHGLGRLDGHVGAHDRESQCRQNGHDVQRE